MHWPGAQRGHIEEDGASKQELHKLADRFHTVLKNPIDTTTLSGNGIADEIHQAAAKISGRGAGENAVEDKAATPGTGSRGAAVDAPKTPEKVCTRDFRRSIQSVGTKVGESPDSGALSLPAVGLPTSGAEAPGREEMDLAICSRYIDK